MAASPSCSARCWALPRSSSRSKAIRWWTRSMPILPQTQCGQCGYPGLQALRRQPSPRAKPTSTSARRAARKASSKLADLLGVEFKPLGGERGTQSQIRRLHRRKHLHRLHAVHPGLPGGCHRRRGQADAHHHRRRMHRLRTVPRALPGGLHQHGGHRGKDRQLEMEISGVRPRQPPNRMTTARDENLYQFHGGVQPPSNKTQSTQLPIAHAPLPSQTGRSAAPACRRSRQAGGPGRRPRAEGPDDRQCRTASFPSAVHAPTSGTVAAIDMQLIAHPSGLPDLCVTHRYRTARTNGSSASRIDYRSHAPDELRNCCAWPVSSAWAARYSPATSSCVSASRRSTP